MPKTTKKVTTTYEFRASPQHDPYATLRERHTGVLELEFNVPLIAASKDVLREFLLEFLDTLDA